MSLADLAEMQKTIAKSGMTAEEAIAALNRWGESIPRSRISPTATPSPALSRPVRPSRWQRISRWLERLGAVVIELPRTVPAFAREFWHELRTGQEPVGASSR